MPSQTPRHIQPSTNLPQRLGARKTSEQTVGYEVVRLLNVEQHQLEITLIKAVSNFDSPRWNHGKADLFDHFGPLGDKMNGDADIHTELSIQISCRPAARAITRSQG